MHIPDNYLSPSTCAVLAAAAAPAIAVSIKKIKQEIIIYVDTKFKDISQRLARDFTQLTERDVYICCMLLADFNTGMIASILNIQNDSVNIHRSRLRKKLGMETDQNLILFLQNV